MSSKKRVTLTIKHETGHTETFSVENEGPWVLAPVFRVINAAVAAHPEEITAVTEAAKMISSMLSACAGVGDLETKVEKK